MEHIHQIVFRYVANSTFHITVFSNMFIISTGAKFLSNLIRLRKKHLFRVKLTKSQCKANHLMNFSFYYFGSKFYFLYIFLFVLLFCSFFRTYNLTLQITFVNIDWGGWNCRDVTTLSLFNVSFCSIIHLRSQVRLGRDGRTSAHSIVWKKEIFLCFYLTKKWKRRRSKSTSRKNAVFNIALFFFSLLFILCMVFWRTLKVMIF